MTKKLTRSITDRKLLGVCGGLGAYLNVDSTLIRLAWTLATFCSVGLGLLAYLAAGIIIPEDTTI